MTLALSSLSDTIAALAAAAAPWLAAIRVGADTHVTGIAWADGLVATTDRALPARDGYTVILSGGTIVAAKLLHREPSLDLALLVLDRLYAITPLPAAPPPLVGSLTVLVAADFDATPIVRLAVVHRQARAGGQGTMLDLTEARVEPGALVLDADGAVLGMAHIETGGAVTIVPYGTIARLVENAARPESPRPALPRPALPRPAGSPSPGPPRPMTGAIPNGRRGWFGLALQPITVPEPLVPRAGQTSGRLVVGITAGGPAEQAGLRVGDVLLSLDGHSTSGPKSLRGFLGSSKIGNRVEVRVLRDAAVATTVLTVAEHP